MPASFHVPKHWQDWVSWLLGFWLLLSPWTLHYSDDSPALRNAVIVGFLLIFAEVVTLSAFRPWEEWATILIGAWLIVSPFVLEFIHPMGTANAIIIGAIVLLLSSYELWRVSTGRKIES